VALSAPAVDAPAPPAGASSRPSPLPPVTDLSLDALRDAVVGLGQPAYRAQQVSGWLYRSSAADFEAMTNVPLALRRALAERYRFSALETVTERVSSDGETRKALLRLPDGQLVESVLMRYPQRADGTGAERATVCVSTQVGCPVRCSFCATGLMGFARNLSSGEILEQAPTSCAGRAGSPPWCATSSSWAWGSPC
jgi:23S rRNA (adenine2503-C2)-methyltransferase